LKDPFFEVQTENSMQEDCNSSPIVANWEYEEIDENMIWFGKDFETYVNPTLNILPGKEEQEFYLKCLVHEYCRDKEPAGTVGMALSTCPQFQIMKAKVSNDQLFLFFFVLLIFAFYLSQDVEESGIEDFLL